MHTAPARGQRYNFEAKQRVIVNIPPLDLVESLYLGVFALAIYFDALLIGLFSASHSALIFDSNVFSKSASTAALVSLPAAGI